MHACMHTYVQETCECHVAHPSLPGLQNPEEYSFITEEDLERPLKKSQKVCLAAWQIPFPSWLLPDSFNVPA